MTLNDYPKLYEVVFLSFFILAEPVRLISVQVIDLWEKHNGVLKITPDMS